MAGETFQRCIAPRCIALSLFFTWGFVGRFPTVLLYFRESYFREILGISRYNLHMLVNIAMLILILVCFKHFEKLAFKKGFQAALLMCTVVASAGCGFVGDASISIAANILLGMTTPMIETAIFVYLVRARDGLAPLLIDTLVLFSIASTALLFQDALAPQVLYLVLPALSALVLMFDRLKLDGGDARGLVVTEDLKRQMPLYCRFAVFLICYHIALNYLIYSSYAITGARMSETSSFFVVVGEIGVLAAVVGISAYSYKRLNVVSLYRTLLLFFQILFVFGIIAVADISYVGFVSCLYALPMAFLKIFVDIVAYKVSLRSNVHPLVVITVMLLFSKAVTFFTRIVQDQLAVFTDASRIIIILSICLLMFTVIYVLVLTERNLWLLTEFRRSFDEEEALERKLLLVMDRCQLSEREQEVTKMLLKGYTLPAIADEICLSQGTVRTYASRIYQKLDVHSRQEFLDRFSPVADKR